MHRSGPLLSVVIVQLFGSLLLSGIGAMVLMGALSASPSELAAHHESRAALVSVAAVVGVVVLWGVITALGLLWKRTWALVSTLIFSFLALATGIGMLVVTATASSRLPVAQTVDLLLGLVLTGLAVWWIVYFARAKVQRDFAAIPRLPISLAVIGWTLLAGGALGVACVPLLGAGASFTLGARVMHGRSAAFAWWATGAISMMAGLGLVELRRWARIATLVWLALLLINATMTWVVLAAQTTAIGLPTLATAVSLGMAACLAEIYFLWTRKAAFAPRTIATAASGGHE